MRISLSKILYFTRKQAFCIIVLKAKQIRSVLLIGLAFFVYFIMKRGDFMDWLGFGASLGSSLLGGMFEENSAEDAFERQKELLTMQNNMARDNTYWINTSKHLWETEDLRKAGLNPLLSVTSPSGSPTMMAPSAPTVQKANTANSAAALGQLAIANKQAEAQLLTAKAADKNAEAAATNADSLKTKTDFEVGEQWESNKKLLEAQTNSALSQANLNDKLAISEGIKNDWMPLIYNAELDLKEKQALMAIVVGSAQASYYYQAGDAAQRSAAAAEYTAETGRMLGLKQIEVMGKEIEFKDVDMDKVRAEARRISADAFSKEIQNSYDEFNRNSTYYRFTRHVGDTISNLIGVPAIVGAFK